MSHDEFKAKYGLGTGRFARRAVHASNRLPTFSHGALDEAQLPPEVDWRVRKAVAEVKNQEQARGATLSWSQLALCTALMSAADPPNPPTTCTYLPPAVRILLGVCHHGRCGGH